MSLDKADLQHRARVLVMAVRQPSVDVVHVPPPELVIEQGQTLIAIGTPRTSTSCGPPSGTASGP